DQLEPPAQRLAVGRTETLPPAVGTRPVLHDSAAQRLAAGLLHHAGGVHDLPLALARAGPRDEDEVVAAAHHVADRDRVEDAVPRRPLLGDPFVGARDWYHVCYAPHPP